MEKRHDTVHESVSPSASRLREADPETARRLDLINRMALHDETDRELTFPGTVGPSPQGGELMHAFRTMAESANRNKQDAAVWSFDIDLTLQMPDDEPGCRGAVPISHLRELQEQGAVVGTCSDREPSDQRKSMEDLGFSPDFCIPKEMLSHLSSLLPSQMLVHVGDDPQRDRTVAIASGWQHRWPHEESL